MVAAYGERARGVACPLHRGGREAGRRGAGTVRSAVGIGLLLAEGIGDTIRVSLAADPEEELPVCWDILKSLNIRMRGPTIIACPTCGRIEVDLIPLAKKIEETFKSIGKPITVAVMGCVVNGPGESQDADIGLAAGKGRGAIFRKGVVVRTVAESEFMSALLQEGAKVIKERYGETIDVSAFDGGETASADDDGLIALTPVEASETLPGRASRRKSRPLTLRRGLALLCGVISRFGRNGQGQLRRFCDNRARRSGTSAPRSRSSAPLQLRSRGCRPDRALWRRQGGRYHPPARRRGERSP